MRQNISALALLAMIAATGACATAGAPSTSGATATKANPDFITTAEVDALPNARDAYEIVQRVRPNWLTKTAGAGISMSGTTGGANVYGKTGGSAGGNVVVYLDNARMGGTEALRDIPISTIGSLRFMDAATATASLPGLGSSIIAGAIVVASRVGH